MRELGPVLDIALNLRARLSCQNFVEDIRKGRLLAGCLDLLKPGFDYVCKRASSTVGVGDGTDKVGSIASTEELVDEEKIRPIVSAAK